MKNSITAVLISVTLAFAAFVAGFYIGKNTVNTKTEIFGYTDTTAGSGSSAEQAPTSSPEIPSDPQGSGGVSTPQTTFPININTATLEELDLIPGIGPVLAQRILDYREEIGRFTSVEELLDVSGIGEKTLAKMLEYITV